MKRRYSSAELAGKARQINQQAQQIELKYGRNTKRWDDSDPEVANLLKMGRSFWQIRPSYQPIHTGVAANLSEDEKAWDLIKRSYLDGNFRRLPQATHCNWTKIMELNKLYNGPIEPTFRYFAEPLQSGLPRLFSITVKPIIYRLNIFGARANHINDLAIKRGYKVHIDSFEWSDLSFGDNFAVNLTLPWLIKSNPDFLKCLEDV
jgi:hypothetical protein